MRKRMKTRAAAATAAATPITSQTTPKTKREKNISHFSFDLIRLLLWPRAKQIKYAIEKQPKQRFNGRIGQSKCQSESKWRSVEECARKCYNFNVAYAESCLHSRSHSYSCVATFYTETFAIHGMFNSQLKPTEKTIGQLEIDRVRSFLNARARASARFFQASAFNHDMHFLFSAISLENRIRCEQLHCKCRFVHHFLMPSFSESVKYIFITSIFGGATENNKKKNVKQKQQSSSEGANVEVEPNERSIERLNIEKKARAASSLPTMRHQTAAYAYHFTFVAAHLGRYQQMPKEIPWILHCSCCCCCWREECEKQLSHSFCICDAFIPSSLMFVSSSSPDRTKIYIQISLLSFTNSFTLMKMWQKLLQPTDDDCCGPAWIISTFSGANECFIWTSPITVRLWSFSWKLVRCRDHLKMPTAIRLQWLGWRIVENQTEDSVFGERFAAAAGATTPHAQTTEMKTNKNIDKKSNKNSGETNFSVRLTGCSQAAAATRTEPGFLLTINFVCAVRAIISLFTTHFLLRFFRLIVDVHTSPGLLRWDTYAAASQTNKMFTNERTRGVFMLLDDGIHTT